MDGPLQIVPKPRPSLKIKHIDEYLVISRTETIEYMGENYAQFQSSLAMLNRMYSDLDIGVSYQKTERTQT